MTKSPRGSAASLLSTCPVDADATDVLRRWIRDFAERYYDVLDHDTTRLIAKVQWDPADVTARDELIEALSILGIETRSDTQP